MKNELKKARDSSEVDINQTKKVERFKAITAILVLATAIVGLIGGIVAFISKSFSDKQVPPVHIQNIQVNNNNGKGAEEVSERHQQITKNIPTSAVLELTNEEIMQINDAWNDCMAGLYSRASETFEQVAQRFLNNPNANIKTLNRARLETVNQNRSACIYYKKFFEPFYNSTERMVTQ